MWLTCGRLTPGGNINFYGSQAHFMAARGLIAIGLAITIIAFIQIVRGIRNKGLVTDGLYATVRHPQHLGIVIWTFGFAFWNSRPIDFIAWFIVVYGFLMLALSEERKLTEDLGERYTAYQGSVPFMIPFVNKGIKIPGHGWKRIATLVAIFIAGIICVPLIVKLIGVTIFF
jgi:protein-S-isoprenylcysteine O-methyltransferase Ste14